MQLPGATEDAEPISDLPHGELLSPALRSRILELISSARMLGKAELLAELANDSDPSVRDEFEHRLKNARSGLEAFLAEEMWRRDPDIIEGHAEIFVPLEAPAELQPQAATASASVLAMEPAAMPAAADHRDWDADKPRFMTIPAVILALAALGFIAHWAYGGLFGNSGAFHFYMERQRCLLVSDALIDMRNGRMPRLPDSREALMREESACVANGLYSASPR